jgi:hypothetical protein
MMEVNARRMTMPRQIRFIRRTAAVLFNDPAHQELVAHLERQLRDGL